MSVLHNMHNISFQIIRISFDPNSDTIQAWTAQLVAHRIGTTTVMCSNPGKGEDFPKKSDLNGD